MKGIAIYVVFIIFITIIIPIALIKGCDIGTENYEHEIKKIKKENEISIYNVKTKKVEKMKLEEYIKGVVAAEMPAEFHIEALKAQAVAARTYAIYRIQKYKNGHPDHPQAPLCTGIHCQAWLSKDELRQVHSSSKWMYEHWPKIEEAVESTKGIIITYDGKPIEPLFHSTSGGMTEDSEKVFLSKVPYLRSVVSPYEKGAPKLKSSVTMTVDEFIQKIESKYNNIKLTKSTLPNKIQLIERSKSGRITKLRIDNTIVTGREIRELFKLNSTNFKITIRGNELKINTIGNGHGVGMSQWGANGMAKNGSTYDEILKHYYTGVELHNIAEQ
ncbi:stage II sporulation protein D [Caldisalinibacter kiritimatiensis]|uniref:Stage II sporulation protein D (SpoIID) n=1 Tax=Caldisalinibacter kiritimatiensis TaxID=1304284 RepID=R1CVQ3_9FIRM|nr:stage II sporulation protein D [Caldisalinibacter kiritimatiensis]EOD00719.1 Stage II sporulation protein D (SpoIID) [Caldisalinibacter kiritimatiensis]